MGAECDRKNVVVVGGVAGIGRQPGSTASIAVAAPSGNPTRGPRQHGRM